MITIKLDCDIKHVLCGKRIEFKEDGFEDGFINQDEKDRFKVLYFVKIDGNDIGEIRIWDKNSEKIEDYNFETINDSNSKFFSIGTYKYYEELRRYFKKDDFYRILAWMNDVSFMQYILNNDPDNESFYKLESKSKLKELENNQFFNFLLNKVDDLASVCSSSDIEYMVNYQDEYKEYHLTELNSKDGIYGCFCENDLDESIDIFVKALKRNRKAHCINRMDMLKTQHYSSSDLPDKIVIISNKDDEILHNKYDDEPLVQILNRNSQTTKNFLLDKLPKISYKDFDLLMNCKDIVGYEMFQKMMPYLLKFREGNDPFNSDYSEHKYLLDSEETRNFEKLSWDPVILLIMILHSVDKNMFVMFKGINIFGNDSCREIIKDIMVKKHSIGILFDYDSTIKSKEGLVNLDTKGLENE